MHPHLAEIELVDYKVRIMDTHHGTGAVTRVLLDSSDGHESWGLDRRLGEHHRGLVGGARRLARVRLPAQSSRRGGAAGRGAESSLVATHLTSEGVSESPSRAPSSGQREEQLVLEVIRSGRLSLGPALERFERDFADWLGVDDAVAVSSGTGALHLGVRALGWSAGDEVITSPFSFVASANCLLYEGVTPVFADIDPVTLNLDPAAAEAALTERTSGNPPGATCWATPRLCRSSSGSWPDGVWDSSRIHARPPEPSTQKACASALAATWPPSPSTPTSS